MSKPTSCSDCGGKNLFQSRPMSAGGGYAPNYLADLGGFFASAKFVLVICRDCGLTRFYADQDARSRLRESKKWSRV